MAEDYQVTSLKTYSAATGNEEASNDAGPFLLGGAATDDGEWNVGDPSADRFPGTTFEGSYEADGTTFLVFDAGTTIIIYSVGGTTASSGYPADLGDLPTLTTTLPVCFAAGTRIATQAGERAVETLEIGDLVTTADGRAVPVRWVGRQTVHTLFAGERARPVRVAAGALGNGLPHADLVLTVDHALILDGLPPRPGLAGAAARSRRRTGGDRAPWPRTGSSRGGSCRAGPRHRPGRPG